MNRSVQLSSPERMASALLCGLSLVIGVLALAALGPGIKGGGGLSLLLFVVVLLLVPVVGLASWLRRRRSRGGPEGTS